MEDMRLYDYDARLIHIENNIISANWSFYYNKIGTFEAHFDLNSNILPVVMNQPYLVLCQGEKQAVITGKRCAEDLALYGRTLNWLLTRRAAPPFAEEDLPPGSDIQTAAHWLINTAFDSSDNLSCSVNPQPFTPIQGFSSSTYRPVNELVEECLARGSAGNRIIFDTGKQAQSRWRFEVIKGKRIPLLLTDGGSGYDMEYTEDLQNYFGGAYYQEKGDGGSLTWKSLQPKETGIRRWMTVLSADSTEQAYDSLKKKKWERTLHTKVYGLDFSFDYSNESYNRGEYHLGDILKVEKEFGSYKITEEKMVIGIDFWYEGASAGQMPILEKLQEDL